MNRAPIVFLALLFLAACVPAQTHEPLPTTTSAIVVQQPTSTTIPPTLTPILLPPTPTITPQVCDPSVADFCITDGHFLLQRPIHPPANVAVDVTYRYASTADGRRDPHTGVEFLNKFGTPVHAAGEGVVIFAGPDSEPIYSPWSDYYGNLVVVEHDDNIYTLYAHLSKILVEQGQKVAAGEQMGEVGQTGVAIGSHLHIEVRRGDVEDELSTENPELWLVPNQSESGSPLGALQLFVMDQAGQLVETADFTLEHHAVQSQAVDVVYYETTYHKNMLKGEENAGIGDLPPGSYRILLLYNGNRVERWVEVESGKLTQAVLVVK